MQTCCRSGPLFPDFTYFTIHLNFTTGDDLQGFRNYDINRVDAISKGEFRRVVEAFAVPLTTEQFESVVAKVPTDKSGALLYVDFLDKFYGRDKPSKDEWVNASFR